MQSITDRTECINPTGKGPAQFKTVRNFGWLASMNNIKDWKEKKITKHFYSSMALNLSTNYIDHLH